MVPESPEFRWQEGVQQNSIRTVPDVSLDLDRLTAMLSTNNEDLNAQELFKILVVGSVLDSDLVDWPISIWHTSQFGY